MCITERSDVDANSLSFAETDRNRFYFHSRQLFTPEVPIDVELGETSRMFCKVFDLGLSGTHVSMFSSDPFILRYSSLEFQYIEKEERFFQFEIHPKHYYIETLNNTAQQESGEVEMRCYLTPLYDQATEKEIVFLRGFVPLQFQIQVVLVFSFKQ